MDSLLTSLGFKEWIVLNGISFLALQIKILKNKIIIQRQKKKKGKIDFPESSTAEVR